eukprot:TRINITY_DN8844_c0_g1_i1.p1 TRINITY_DN8844_c0_g1~~TRINITY_DN8844_c0_g1_i1.p1  ORF type:complete len:274 (-),score=31.56 TRINITY_DN8844_c0_g1_i1:213-1034(-)
MSIFMWLHLAVLICCFSVAVGAFPVDRLDQWIAANPHRFEPEVLPHAETKPWMKNSLLNRSFQFITGGMPVRCGAHMCTVCFCWDANVTQPNTAQCLTSFHVWNLSHHNMQLQLQSGPIDGLVVRHNEFYDWAIFEVNYAAQTYFGGIDLMNNFDLTPIIGFSRPIKSEAVWKLGVFTGMSIGRVVHINEAAGEFSVDGIDGDEGDSGGAVCSGEVFHECILVGMVKAGDSKGRFMRAVLAERIHREVNYPVKFLPRMRDEIVRIQSERRRAS